MARNKQVWDHYRKHNRPVIVLEVGVVKRNVTWRCGINGITGDAYHGPTNMPNDRFEHSDLEIQPWRDTTNGNIIICGQHDDSAQWFTHNDWSVAQWIFNTVESWRAYDQASTFIIRPHPRNRFDWNKIGSPDKLGYTKLQQPNKVEGSYDDFDFDKALQTAKLVINYNSNPAIEAVLAGVPIMTHPSSRCWPVAQEIKHTDVIQKPNRQQWANDLCYQEWTESEIRSGKPFERIRTKLEELVK